jgi:hypothetical protein
MALTTSPEYKAYMREKEEAIKNNPFASPRIVSSISSSSKRIESPRIKSVLPSVLYDSAPPAYKLPTAPSLPSPRSVKNIIYEEKMKLLEEQYKKDQAARDKETDRQIDLIYEQKRKAKAAAKKAKKVAVGVAFQSEMTDIFSSDKKNVIIQPYVPIKSRRKADGGFRLSDFEQPLF